MKKIIKYLLTTPITFGAIIPAVSCGCSSGQEQSKDTIPESKMIIKNGVLSGFVDGFNPKEYKSLVIPSTVTTISASAFSGNFVGDDCLLTSIKIPSSVKTIETKAFYGNTSIKTYDMSDFSNVDNYDWKSDAFAESSTSGEIIYPTSNNDSLNNQIDYLLCDAGLALGWFDSTKERTVENEFLNIDSDNILYGFVDDFLTKPHSVLYTKLSIPVNVVRINKNAFYDETNQTSKLLSISAISFNYVDPETEYVNLQSIGENAFRASNLSKINLKPGILTIGKSSFQDCTSLKEVTFPYTLISIGDCAFKGCNQIEQLSFPSTLVSLGSEAFKACSKLSYIDVEQFSSCPANWNTNAFEGIADSGKIICKPSYAQEWKAYFIQSGLTNWTYTDKIDLLDGYVSLINPFPVESELSLEQVSSHYYASLDAEIQILIDDIYHSFYEWSKTINQDVLTLTKFDMLIKNASVDTEYKLVSFNAYYDIEGTIEQSNESKPFSAKGSWSFKNLPFEIVSATNVSTEGEEPRKFVKLVNNKLSENKYWYVYINESYTLGDQTGELDSAIIDKDSLSSITEYPLDKVGLFMNINRFIDYSESNWTWGILSSYLQKITVK